MQSIIEQQKANCPFCKIVKGGIPSKKVFESSEVLAILDINPAVAGHVLVMPKEHYPIMPLIPQETLSDLFLTVIRIADIEKFLFLKQGTTIFIANGAVAGQQSSHFMVHIIPRDSSDVKQLNLALHEVDKKKNEDISSRLAGILTMRLKEQYEQYPLKDGQGNMIPLKRKSSKEYVIAIIEKNPQLKEALIAEPEQFKNAVPLNNQLSEIFEGIDIDEIILHFVPGYDKDSKTGVAQEEAVPEVEEEKKDSLKKPDVQNEDKKREDDKADLDIITRLFK
jgi:histidine triad (HIT) family protein